MITQILLIATKVLSLAFALLDWKDALAGMLVNFAVMAWWWFFRS